MSFQKVRDRLQPLRPYYDRHRVLVLSVGNAAAIFGVACLIAMAVIGTDPARVAAASSAHSGVAPKSAPAPAPVHVKAPRPVQSASGATRPSRAGSRDYEVEVRGPAPRRTQAQNARAPTGFSQAPGDPSARQRAEDDDEGPRLERE